MISDTAQTNRDGKLYCHLRNVLPWLCRFWKDDFSKMRSVVAFTTVGYTSVWNLDCDTDNHANDVVVCTSFHNSCSFQIDVAVWLQEANSGIWPESKVYAQPMGSEKSVEITRV